MQITLAEIYQAIKEQADYVNLNNSIHSLEYCKTEIEFKEKDYMKYKVGDKVRIREDLVPFHVYDDISALLEMLSASGKVITICGCGRSAYEMDNGYYYSSEMFDQNWKEDKFMKTSEFKKELRKMGYTFEGNLVNNENNLVITWISKEYVNKIETSYNYEISPKLFDLITKYAATPIAERKDEKLFNVRFKDERWDAMPWIGRDGYVLYRDYESSGTPNKLWTLAQIEEYGIDNEEVYERVPVED